MYNNAGYDIYLDSGCTNNLIIGNQISSAAEISAPADNIIQQRDWFEVESTLGTVPAFSVNYNPSAGSYSAATITYASTTGSGTALTVTQSGTGDIVSLTNTSSATADAVKITNLGTGKSFVVEDEQSDATPFVIDASGNVGIGTTTISGDLQVWDTASSTVYIGDASHSGCIVMGDSDNNGVTYITVNNGVLTATTTKPAICK